MKALKIIILCVTLSFIPYVVSSEEIGKNWSFLFSQARELQDRGFFQDAILIYKDIIVGSPQDDLVAKSQYLIGGCYMKLGNFEIAREEYQRFIASYPEREEVPFAKCLIGLCYEEEHHYSKAINIYREVVANYPESDATQLAQSSIEVLNEKWFRNPVTRKLANIWSKILIKYPLAVFIISAFTIPFLYSILFLTLCLLTILVRAVSNPAYDDNSPPKWKLSDIFKLYLFYAGIIGLGKIFLSLIFYQRNYIASIFKVSPTIEIPLGLIGYFTLFLLIYRCLKKYHSTIPSLGFSAKNLKRYIPIGLTIVAVVVSLEIGYLHLTRSLSKNPIYSLFPPTKSLISITLTFFLFVFVAPLVEEIFHRGFLYPVLKKNMGIKWGMILGSIFFASVHLNAFFFIWYVILGFIFTLFYEKSKSLIPSITTHIFFNTLCFILFFLNPN